MNKIKKWAPYLLSAFILAIGAYFLSQNLDQYLELLEFSIPTVLILALVGVLFILGNGVNNYVLYRHLGAQVSLNESVGLAAINTLANYLPFAGGMLAKSVYLRKRHQVPYGRFFSATLSLFVCLISANGLLGLLVLSSWFLRGDPVQPILWFGYGVMFAIILILFVPIPERIIPQRLKKSFDSLTEGWQIIIKTPSLFLTLIGIQLVMMVLSALRFWLAFRLYSQEISFGQAILFATAIVLTQIVSLTPGGLGVREGIVAALAITQSYPADIAVLAVATDRLIATIVFFILGTIYTTILGQDQTKREFEV
ncbi:MAG: lysylphosphatidylglycerol synthase transmembrane domain-containing protein [Chloroflexota bacterium]